MIVNAILAVPLGVIWMVVTSSINPGSFLVGFLVGFAILLCIKTQKVEINYQKLPKQMVALAIYTVTLLRDIFMSSIDVAKRVLDPDLPLNAGIITVPTQDENESEFTAAFSAHGITITPGELVVDFEGTHAMYVHCLDVNASSQNADAAQTKRLKLLNQIMGKD